MEHNKTVQSAGEHAKPLQTVSLDYIRKRTQDFKIPGTFIAELHEADLKFLLSRNDTNRKISDFIVEKYVADMKAGRWTYNGSDAVVMDWDGNMKNAGHRCTAALIAKKSLIINFSTGIDPETFATMDSGKGRSVPDILGLSGYLFPAVSSNVLRNILTWQKGAGVETRDYHFRQRMSNNDMKLYIDKLGDAKREIINGLYSHTRKYTKRCSLLQVPIVITMYYILTVEKKYDRDVVDEFFEYLATGIGISPNRHPAVYYLREKLIKNSAHAHNDIRTLTQGDKLALLAKGFIGFFKNKQVTGMKLTKTDCLKDILK